MLNIKSSEPIPQGNGKKTDKAHHILDEDDLDRGKPGPEIPNKGASRHEKDVGDQADTNPERQPGGSRFFLGGHSI